MIASFFFYKNKAGCDKIPWNEDLSYVSIDSVRVGKKEEFEILGWATHKDIRNRDKEHWKRTG